MEDKFSDEHKARVLKDVKALIRKAKKDGIKGVEHKLKSGNTTALSRAIKTQEQADFFMKVLRAL